MQRILILSVLLVISVSQDCTDSSDKPISVNLKSKASLNVCIPFTKNDESVIIQSARLDADSNTAGNSWLSYGKVRAQCISMGMRGQRVATT